MTSAVDSPLEDVVVGRATELARFKEILSARRPALIMLMGERANGKTSLLNMVRQNAIVDGWNVVPQNRGESLTVNADTTEETFSTQLHSLINSPSARSFIEKSPKSAVESSAESLVLSPIVEEMRARAPFLLLIDGFQAKEGFTEWFRYDFLIGIVASNAPIIVIVAEQAGVSKLDSSADQTISLDKIDMASIRSHFTAIGEKLTPPIEKAELEVYINTAHARLDLLNSLTRILSLAGKGPEA